MLLLSKITKFFVSGAIEIVNEKDRIKGNSNDVTFAFIIYIGIMAGCM